MAKQIEIKVPDIGDFDEVEVVEILVAQGDAVEIDDPIVSIESDKATMEIPASAAGLVAEVRVQEGDKVSEGSVLALLEAAKTDDEAAPAKDGPEEETAAAGVVEAPVAAAPPAPVAEAPAEAAEDSANAVQPADTDPASRRAQPPETTNPAGTLDPQSRPLSPAAAFPIPDREGLPHASPLVRRYARELGVPIGSTPGSGPKGRVLTEDLKAVVRERFASDEKAASGTGVPALPTIDFSQFGPVRTQKLTRIQKASGPSLHRSWLNVPHVTQHDEADVTALEAFRSARKADAAERGLRLSPLLFVMKALASVLREFPTFRSSLSPEADALIVKDFFHLGIAVDTEEGLVVPVIRDVDRKGVFELAEEVSDAAERARQRKLSPEDLRGAVMTISSLGGIGGTAFTPIVNAPEVAILGLSKTRIQPVWQGPMPASTPVAPPSVDGAAPLASSEAAGISDAELAGTEPGRFVPRQVMPLSLSYDHRVIDGAEAVRFTTRLASVLSDPLLLLL